MTAVANPFPLFTDNQSRLIDDGRVYVGLPDQDPETNPAAVFWDEARTIPAAQPLQTVGGYIVNAGSPAVPYVDGDYSVRVRQANGAAVFYRSRVVNSLTDIVADLAAVSSSIERINASRGVSVLDFIPAEKWPSIRAGTNTDNLTQFFQAAAVASRTALPDSDQEGSVFVPNGRYYLNSVGIRGVLFHGESTGGTELRAFSPGNSGQFIMDAMYDTDGTTFNTVGGGWCVGMTIDGRLPNGTNSGRSGMRTYGGAQTIERVRIRYCNYGLAVGLPIWTTVKNVLARDCDRGFYTFHNSPGDNGTSATFLNCWALSCTTYGFHISQLYYSQFIGCVSQDAGVHNWYLEGDLNGTTACYSLQFIGCATEGHGTPFYFRRGRDITVINPRIIIPDSTTNYITFDDSTGSLSDFSTVSTPGSGKYHLATTNGTPYSVALVNCLVTYAAAAEGVFARFNAGAPGTTQNGLSGSSLSVGNKKVVGQQGVAISNVETITAAPTMAQYNDLVNSFNALLSRLRGSSGHGLIGG